MPGGTRVLVVDSDVESQGEIQKLLLRRRFVALGGADLGEETLAMARAFRPDVILVNLDNGEESRRMADSVAGELPQTRIVLYSRRGNGQSAGSGSSVSLGDRGLRVVSASEKTLLETIEAALQAPPGPAPVVADNGQRRQERDVSRPVAVPGGEARVSGPTPRSRQDALPFLRHFAQLACDWLQTRSSRDEESLMATLAEDVQAPSFGGRGRRAVLHGLGTIARRLGTDMRLVPGELDWEPVLAVLVSGDDRQWHRGGHIVLRLNENSVGYIDYREDEPTDEAPAEGESASAAG